ncbi:ATP-dependent DNA ligase [Bradyrhizobium japonicum]
MGPWGQDGRLRVKTGNAAPSYGKDDPYLRIMRTAFEFCLPTAAKVVPAGPDWIHEIKYDGYRLRVERQGKTVRLFTRNGHD